MFAAFFENINVMLGMMILATLIISLVLAVVPHLLWLLIWIIGKIAGFHVGYAPFGWTALGLLLLCWLVIAYGFFIGRWRLQTTSWDYANKELPAAFEGYRIVHISDWHLSTFDDNKEKLSRIVDEINKLEPDLICFTGDLVTVGVKEAKPYKEELRRLKAKDGIVSVLGNHDFLIYSFRDRTEADRNRAVADLDTFIRDTLGWHLLRNEHWDVVRGEDTITIAGVDNIQGEGQGFRTVNRGKLSHAIAGVDHFTILLSHDPSHWMAEVVPQTNIPLTLSGHTHAAQIRLFGWTPARWMFEQTDGRYDHDGQTLYVNIGLGCTTPVRLGAQPEITVITLKKN